MPTIKQRIAFEEVVANRGSVMKAMRKAKYAPNTVKNPKNLTDSDGFKELCEEVGLTDLLLTKALVEDIINKPQNRKAELELGFKIKGRLKENEEKGNTYNQLNIFAGEQLKRIATRILNGDPTGEEKSD